MLTDCSSHPCLLAGISFAKCRAKCHGSGSNEVSEFPLIGDDDDTEPEEKEQEDVSLAGLQRRAASRTRWFFIHFCGGLLGEAQVFNLTRHACVCAR